MELTAAAAFITSTFASFDYSILSLFHQLQQMFGSILNPVAAGITLAGEKGAIFLLLGVICLFSKKSRRMGIGIILAIAICYCLNNLLIKDFVCRPRPFEMSDIYNSWWVAAGSFPEDSFSFPSGHVAAAAAAMMVYMMHRRHFLNFLLAVLVVLIMGSARMYLMGHYPSDVVAAIVVGMVAGLIAYFVVQVIWNAIWKKRGGVSAMQNAGYQPNRGTSFDIPMGAPKPAREAGTSPFAAEALNDPMNFTAGGAIATNYNTQSFQAVPDSAAQTTAFQAYYGNAPASAAATTQFQAYYGDRANPQAAAQAQAQYQNQPNQPVYPQNGGYTTAAQNTTDFKNFYDSLSGDPVPNAAATTEFRAYMQGDMNASQAYQQTQVINQAPSVNQAASQQGQVTSSAPMSAEAQAFSRDSYGSKSSGRHAR